MNLIEHFLRIPTDEDARDLGTGIRGCHLAVIQLAGGGPVLSLVRLLALRAIMARRRRLLLVDGDHEIRCFGFYPDLGTPTVVYELGSAAQRYVERHVLPESVGARRLVRRLLGCCAGCDPALGAIVITGRAP